MDKKVWIVVVATWVWCWSSIKVESASKICPKNPKPNNSPLSYESQSFTVDDATYESYVEFLGYFRNKVKSDEVSYELPILCEESKILKGKEYIMIDLTYNKHTITLALKVVDLYFVAYKAGTTSYFFQDFVSLKTVLFKETKQVDLPFTGSYTNLPDRLEVDLGKFALGKAIQWLYNNDQKNIKTGVVTVVEMVSEAARLRVIPRAFQRGFEQRIRPLYDILSFENAWKKLSNAIQNSKDGSFDPVVLRLPDNTPKEITKVTQVSQNLGILKYRTEDNKQEIND